MSHFFSGWFLLALSLVLVSSRPPAPPASAAAFRHPGVLNTQQSLAAAAAQLKAGDPARRAGYQQVSDYLAQHPAPTTFPAVVYAVAGAGSPTEDQIRRDAELAYAYALRWATTGEAAAARQAIAILNGYARTFQRYDTAPKPDGSPTPFRQTYLEAAWVAPTFVAAAEILRYYRGGGGKQKANWPAADVAQFNIFLLNLKTNYIDPLPAGTDWVNNWQVSAGYAQLALGVWFDDRAQYAQGYAYIRQVLPQVFYPNGNVKELCDRDCHHPQYTLTGLTDAAEIALIQGDKALYEFNNQQLRVGWEKLADAIDHNAGSCVDCSQHREVWPGIEVAYRYYGTPRLAVLRAVGAPYGVPSDDTFAGFSSLTHGR